MKCPKCGSTKTVTERSPDGESYCDDCKFRWSNRTNVEAEKSSSNDPSQEAIMKYFKFDHLPEKLQLISKPFADLAHGMVCNLPRNAERTAGLRKLLEAKDCAVRASLG